MPRVNTSKKGTKIRHRFINMSDCHTQVWSALESKGLYRFRIKKKECTGSVCTPLKKFDPGEVGNKSMRQPQIAFIRKSVSIYSEMLHLLQCITLLQVVQSVYQAFRNSSSHVVSFWSDSNSSTSQKNKIKMSTTSRIYCLSYVQCNRRSHLLDRTYKNFSQILPKTGVRQPEHFYHIYLKCLFLFKAENGCPVKINVSLKRCSAVKAILRLCKIIQIMIKVDSELSNEGG